MTSYTIEQKPRGDDFAKARELIEIRGAGELSLQDRRVMNVLYANAGLRLCDDVDHTISIAELRGSHKGGERVRESVQRLMTTLVQVPVVDSNGKSATKFVQVLSDTTTTDDENDPTGQVVYSFSKGMRAIIKDSTLWGRVRTAVVFAFTSKYSLAFYELITARINLKHKWQEDFTLEDFRGLLGVPTNKLLRTPDLLRKVIQPAEAEVSGLADFGVKIDPIRTGGTMRGLVTGFRVSWWRKDIPALQDAYKEINRSKVGRIERLTSKAETSRNLVSEAIRDLMALETEATSGGSPAGNDSTLAQRVNDEVAEKLAQLRAAERRKAIAK